MPTARWLSPNRFAGNLLQALLAKPSYIHGFPSKYPRYFSPNRSILIKKFSCLLLAVALVVSNLASAADGIGCSGKIDVLSVHGPDGIFLKLSGMNTVVKICDLGKSIGTTYPITAQQCKVAYSALLFALSTDRSLTVVSDYVINGTHCQDFANWEVATARYIPLTR